MRKRIVPSLLLLCLFVGLHAQDKGSQDSKPSLLVVTAHPDYAEGIAGGTLYFLGQTKQFDPDLYVDISRYAEDKGVIIQ